jgi:hypothetical protein
VKFAPVLPVNTVDIDNNEDNIGVGVGIVIVYLVVVFEHPAESLYVGETHALQTSALSDVVRLVLVSVVTNINEDNE